MKDPYRKQQQQKVLIPPQNVRSSALQRQATPLPQHYSLQKRNSKVEGASNVALFVHVVTDFQLASSYVLNCSQKGISTHRLIF